jgi:pyruvate dehydrogenase E1 component beta subunit
MRRLSIQEALNEALHEEMEQNDTVFVLGEDVGVYGGHLEVTKGLFDRFGPQRVMDTPISEEIIVGSAVGAAMGGMRPVAEIQHIDFIALALDAIVNHATALPYAWGGQVQVPLVIRTQGGSYSVGAQHAKSLEAWLVHIPGLKVVMPSTPYDAKGLLKAAIRDPNPVVFIEHKLTYRHQGEVPQEEYVVQLGTADIKRDGQDVTIVATSRLVHESMTAAEALEKDGINVEIVDPRTLVPLDLDTILKSLKKTGRLLVVHEGWKTGGFGAEVVAKVCETGFDLLAGPTRRLGAEVPPPFSPVLEKISIPRSESIADTVKDMLT